MPRINVSIESMRIGGLPASDHYPSDPASELRRMLDEGERGSFFVNYPPLRTCRCGAQTVRGTPADAGACEWCGSEPPHAPVPPGETVRAVTSVCEQCGKPVVAGARRCSSPRCQAKAIRARRPGDITG